MRTNASSRVISNPFGSRFAERFSVTPSGVQCDDVDAVLGLVAELAAQDPVNKCGASQQQFDEVQAALTVALGEKLIAAKDWRTVREQMRAGGAKLGVDPAALMRVLLAPFTLRATRAERSEAAATLAADLGYRAGTNPLAKEMSVRPAVTVGQRAPLGANSALFVRFGAPTPTVRRLHTHTKIYDATTGAREAQRPALAARVLSDTTISDKLGVMRGLTNRKIDVDAIFAHEGFQAVLRQDYDREIAVDAYDWELRHRPAHERWQPPAPGSMEDKLESMRWKLNSHESADEHARFAPDWVRELVNEKGGALLDELTALSERPASFEVLQSKWKMFAKHYVGGHSSDIRPALRADLVKVSYEEQLALLEICKNKIGVELGGEEVWIESNNLASRLAGAETVGDEIDVLRSTESYYARDTRKEEAQAVLQTLRAQPIKGCSAREIGTRWGQLVRCAALTDDDGPELVAAELKKVPKTKQRAALARALLMNCDDIFTYFEMRKMFESAPAAPRRRPPEFPHRLMASGAERAIEGKLAKWRLEAKAVAADVRTSFEALMSMDAPLLGTIRFLHAMPRGKGRGNGVARQDTIKALIELHPEWCETVSKAESLVGRASVVVDAYNDAVRDAWPEVPPSFLAAPLYRDIYRASQLPASDASSLDELELQLGVGEESIVAAVQNRTPEFIDHARALIRSRETKRWQFDTTHHRIDLQPSDGGVVARLEDKSTGQSRAIEVPVDGQVRECWVITKRERQSDRDKSSGLLQLAFETPDPKDLRQLRIVVATDDGVWSTPAVGLRALRSSKTLKAEKVWSSEGVVDWAQASLTPTEVILPDPAARVLRFDGDVASMIGLAIDEAARAMKKKTTKAMPKSKRPKTPRKQASALRW